MVEAVIWFLVIVLGLVTGAFSALGFLSILPG